MALARQQARTSAAQISACLSLTADPTKHYSDGLDPVAVRRLIAEAAERTARAPGMTSALLDGSAAERRRRREARRALAAVVWSLRVRPPVPALLCDIEEIAS